MSIWQKLEAMNKLLPVNCPICKKKFNYYGSEFRPFCSELCKEIDLGHWVTGGYAVEGRAATPDEIADELSQVHLNPSSED